MNKKYFSHQYEINLTGDESWLDTRLDQDIKLYIDPFLIFKSDIKEFSGLREKFFDFFRVAFELARQAGRENSAKAVLESILEFPEVMEIRLGDSKGVHGAGPGKKFARACASSLIKLAKQGQTNIDHFEEIEIFTKGISHDGISDMTASLIKQELVEYTINICEELNIPRKYLPVKYTRFSVEDYYWDNACIKLPENPYIPGTGVLLVPKCFLCATHAISSTGFSEYMQQAKDTETLRALLNYEVAKEVKKIKISKPKAREIAESHPELVREYIAFVEESESIRPYDLDEDTKNLYRVQKDSYEFVSANPCSLQAFDDQSFDEFIDQLLRRFKHCVEEEKGYILLWNDPVSKGEKETPRSEDRAQCLFANIVIHYCDANNIDISREVETGRGPVDFKFSQGYSKKVLVELKLAKSTKLFHGLRTQLPLYLKASRVQNGYYVVVSHSSQDEKRVEKLQSLTCDHSGSDSLFSESSKNKIPFNFQRVVVVDARLDNKKSASKA